VTAIRKDEQEEITMAIQSVATAGLQLMLAAHAAEANVLAGIG
jgi:hypothetical protein